MSGFSVMVRCAGRRAEPVYPFHLIVREDSSLACSGWTTARSKDLWGIPTRPCSFIRREDAEWFRRHIEMLDRAAGRDNQFFIKDRP